MPLHPWAVRATLATMRRVFLIALLQAALSASAAAQQMHRLDTRPGIHMPVLSLSPARGVRATLILLAGGDGRLRLRSGLPRRLRNNSLVRIRYRLVEAGIRVLLVDAPSDRRRAPGLRNWRLSAPHLRDLRALVAWAARRWPGQPLWMAGTSRGAVSAAALAAGPLRGLSLRGVILVAPVIRPSRRDASSLAGVRLETVRVPVVVLMHAADACHVSRPAEVRRAVRRLPQATYREITRPSTGAGDPCTGRSAHGFWGLDGILTAAIVGAMALRR